MAPPHHAHPCATGMTDMLREGTWVAEDFMQVGGGCHAVGWVRDAWCPPTLIPWCSDARAGEGEHVDS